jgi:hypothetical protein
MAIIYRNFEDYFYFEFWVEQSPGLDVNIMLIRIVTKFEFEFRFKFDMIWKKKSMKIFQFKKHLLVYFTKIH